MRFTVATVLLLVFISSSAVAATDSAFSGEVLPPVTDTELKLFLNGRLSPISDYELSPMVSYDISCNFTRDGEELAAFRVWVNEGFPAVLSSSSGMLGASEESYELIGNSFVVARSKWSGGRPVNFVGQDLDWLEYFDACTVLQLKDLRFDIFFPEADYVRIAVDRIVRPAAVIDDRVGNIIFEMHYPPQGEPEPYGVLEAPLTPREPELRHYILEVRASRAGKLLGGWNFSFSNDLSTEFAVNPDEFYNPRPPYEPAIIGRHAAYDDELKFIARTWDDKVRRQMIEHRDRMRMGGLWLAFLFIQISWPDADEIVFELYEAGPGDSRGPLVDSRTLTWGASEPGQLTRRPFGM